jgi:hypothetical protein
MAGVADEQDRVAERSVRSRLGVDLRDERTGRVDRPEPTRPRLLVDARGDPVGGEDDGLSLGDLVLALDEDDAASLELADDVGVVDDLLADVHRRAP